MLLSLNIPENAKHGQAELVAADPAQLLVAEDSGQRIDEEISLCLIGA